MLLLVVAGLFIIAMISVICIGAHKIKAESFEITTRVIPWASFSVKIHSPERRGGK